MGRKMQKMSNFNLGSRPQRMWLTMTRVKERNTCVDELPGPSFTPDSFDSPAVKLDCRTDSSPNVPTAVFLQSTGQQVERRNISTLPSNSLQRLLSINGASV